MRSDALDSQTGASCLSVNGRPPINSLIRFDDGHEAVVTAHTERGFTYKGPPRSFIPRWGMSFTGEGEIFTDIPEYQLFKGHFTIVPPSDTVLAI